MTNGTFSLVIARSVAMKQSILRTICFPDWFALLAMTVGTGGRRNIYRLSCGIRWLRNRSKRRVSKHQRHCEECNDEAICFIHNFSGLLCPLSRTRNDERDVFFSHREKRSDAKIVLNPESQNINVIARSVTTKQSASYIIFGIASRCSQ